MKYKSDAFESIHESVSGLYKLGIVDEKTMKKFDKGCLIPQSSTNSKTTTASPSINKPVLVAKNRA
jgi:putative transcriptional regulator